jgi:hypothetical protein
MANTGQQVTPKKVSGIFGHLTNGLVGKGPVVTGTPARRILPGASGTFSNLHGTPARPTHAQKKIPVAAHVPFRTIE